MWPNGWRRKLIQPTQVRCWIIFDAFKGMPSLDRLKGTWFMLSGRYYPIVSIYMANQNNAMQ